MRGHHLAFAALLTAACGASHGVDDDGGALDGGQDGAGFVDATRHDGGIRDAGGADAMRDAGDRDARAVDACLPDCGIRVCGGDGCGGVCGRPSCAPGVESFEGLLAEVITDFFGIVPTPFTFPSGVGLTQPVPNEYGTDSVLVVDCVDGGGFYGFRCADSADAIPDGTAFLGTAYLAVYDIELTFPAPAASVSIRAILTDPGTGTMVALEAYDDDGVLLDTATAMPVPVEAWRDNHLLVQAPTDSAGIRRVLIRSDSGSWGFDLLEWE